MPIYVFYCEKCKKRLEVVQPMNIEHKLIHCGKLARRIWTIFRTNKDLMYNFTTRAFGKPIDIYSRRQYKQLLKQHGLADATVNECLSVKPKDDIKEKSRRVAKELTKEIYRKGAMDWIRGKENPNGKDKLGG